MRDEIMEELWRIKDEIAAETAADTQALFRRLRTVELRSGQQWVSPAPRHGERPTPESG